MAAGRGGRIVFSGGKQTDYDIWYLDLDTRRVVQLTSGKNWNDKPRWSPDGQWVVFVSNASQTPCIYKVHVETKEIVPLVQNDRWNDFPAFSPDGKRLGYISNISGNNDLFIADADGSNPRQITTHQGNDSTFAWMPDGRSVLFSSEQSGNADIWRINLQTGEQQQLTFDKGMDIYPAPSPDGRYVAFVSDRQLDPASAPSPWSDRDLDVWLMNVQGKHPVRVTSNRGSDRCVAWSPDGKCLVYASSKPDDAAERLRLLDVSELLAAYETDDQETIQHAAARLCTAGLDIERRDLDAEIDARRHACLWTSLLPDWLVRPLYGEVFFGSERYPHWIATPAASSQRYQEVEADSVA